MHKVIKSYEHFQYITRVYWKNLYIDFMVTVLDLRGFVTRKRSRRCSRRSIILRDSGFISAPGSTKKVKRKGYDQDEQYQWQWYHHHITHLQKSAPTDGITASSVVHHDTDSLWNNLVTSYHVPIFIWFQITVTILDYKKF